MTCLFYEQVKIELSTLPFPTPFFVSSFMRHRKSAKDESNQCTCSSLEKGSNLDDDAVRKKHLQGKPKYSYTSIEG